MAKSRIQMQKVISLITLTLVSAVGGICNEYNRSRVGPMFFTSTLIVMGEVVKLVISTLMVFKENGFQVRKCSESLRGSMMDTIEVSKIGMLSVLYVLQNNLYYFSSLNLEASTFQVVVQSKILTTAIFAVVFFKKSLLLSQWCALIILTVGVALVQISGIESKSAYSENKLYGFSSAFGACLISGFSGNSFEMILKASDMSLWVRNFQLALFSIPLSFGVTYIFQWDEIESKGWFYGYDYFVYFLIVLQAVSGLIVSIAVKFAGNILKVFATSLSITITCFSSAYFFNFQPNYIFALGAAFVIFSSLLYTKKPSFVKITNPEYSNV